CPLGYRREGGQLVVDEVAAPIVHRVFEEYATGRMGQASLADHLNAIGLPLPPNPDWPKARTRWSYAGLKGMLRNPSYVGKVRVGDQLIEGQHPAIVPLDLFEKCQGVRIGQRTRRTAYKGLRNPYP